MRVRFAIYAGSMARIDVPPGEGSELHRVWAANPTMGKIAGTFSMEVYGNTQLAVRERELVRMRIAQINDCFT